MSYEGYYQAICANGHFYGFSDDYVYESGQSSCPTCKAGSTWTNQVDNTNCDSYGYIPVEELTRCFLISPEIVETCNLGHPHITKPAVFRIPSREETDALRTYERDGHTINIMVDVIMSR